jgi:hypothetical protein
MFFPNGAYQEKIGREKRCSLLRDNQKKIVNFAIMFTALTPSQLLIPLLPP